MRWAVLVALVLLGLGAYAMIGSARELGAAVGTMSSGHTGAAGPPRLVGAVRITKGAAMLDLRCENEIGCGGEVALKPDGGARTGIRYAIDHGRTVRYALPLESRARHATLSLREDSGVAPTAKVALNRS